jgi:hypothetical protein
MADEDVHEAAIKFGISALAIAGLRNLPRERIARMLEQSADELRREVLSGD